MENLASPQSGFVHREPVVAGRFYSKSPEKLKSDIASYFQSATPYTPQGTVRAILAPHAGYVYSAQVAASAYNQLPQDAEYIRIILIGSSHHTSFNGASVYNRGHYITPLGKVEVDLELARELITNEKVFTFREDAHSSEHSLEVQLPFLQYRFGEKLKILPVVIATNSTKTCREIAQALKPFFNEKNLFVISTDFSHYPSYNDAKRIDSLTAEAITGNAPETFVNQLKENTSEAIPNLHTSICGWTSVLTLLCLSSEDSRLTYHKIQYMNSGDQPFGDKDQVVGYYAITLTAPEDKEFGLAASEKEELIDLAKKSIETFATVQTNFYPEKNTFSANLLVKTGAFVTVYKNKKLRGCIGRFNPSQPLYQTICDMAISASFNDTRFPPVTEEELNELELEISVLTPLKRINSIDDIELGKHGIFIRRGNKTGTYLPKVAKDTGWGLEEFLGHCARDKARIGWEGWKDAELYTFEALVFGNKD